MRSPLRTGRSGFTLIEVLVASSVLTIAIAGAAFMLTSAFGAYRHQDRTMDVDRLVHNQVETYTSIDFTQISNRLRNGRRPDTIPKPDDMPPPGMDYVYHGGGEATVEWDLKPPQDGQEDWQPKPLAYGFDKKPLPVGPGDLRAKVRLQFWDPTFDSPAALDRGLVRASFSLKGAGVNQQAVKYVTRSRWSTSVPE